MLIVLFALFLTAKLRYSGTAPVKLQATQCDQYLWKHVYEPDRLKVLEPCTAVEGKVAFVHRNADGDIHIGLDPSHTAVLNLVNVTHSQRKLVIEIICDHTPGQPNAQAACRDFHSQIAVPNAGDRVRITGAYVTDRDNGWNEIHPVTRIELLY